VDTLPIHASAFAHVLSAVEVTDALDQARAELTAAEQHLRRLGEQTADLAGELAGVIAPPKTRSARKATGHAD
jgi:uncharacterized protein (DUF3084 family)